MNVRWPVVPHGQHPLRDEDANGLKATEATTRLDQGGWPLIRGVELVKSFGSTSALRGGEISVQRGEIVALTGPSGSGKSTLMHCLAGILRPDSGRAEFVGTRVDAMSDAERTRLRRSQFGFVFQFGQLVPELTAVENVALPLILSGCRRRRALAAAQEWLCRFDLGSLTDRRPCEMSGGQAQRVAVARAMVIEPRVVFADEPTGSLDSRSGAVVLAALIGAAREQDTAVLIVTHAADVAGRADRVVEVVDGMVGVPAAASAT